MKTTSEANVLSQLAFNTYQGVSRQVVLVSTQNGQQLGYVAKGYVKTNLPEPNAPLHHVAAGRPGFAISIAETYYKK